MEDILVGRLMTSDPITVGPDTLVEDAANTMLDNGIGSLIVVDGDGDLLGILTTTDFVNIVAASKPKAQTTVERYMSTDVITVTAQDSVQEAADTMIANGVHHLPVVDETEGVIGILTTTDVAAYVSTAKKPSP